MNAKTDEPVFTYILPAIREDGVSFVACAMQVIETPELVAQVDRLYGTNMLGRGSPLERAIDKACNRQDVDFKKFLQFVWDFVFTRMPLIEEKPKK